MCALCHLADVGFHLSVPMKKAQTRAGLSALQWFPGAMLAILAKEGSGHSFLYGLLNIEADPCEICDCYPPVMKHNGKSANLFDDFTRL
jgi:hypothetical protein